MRCVAALAACALIGSGCAQYKRPPILIKVPSFYEHRTQFGNLAVVADPYFSSGDSNYLFNTNLIDKGFLAVHLILFNEGNSVYDVSKARATLIRDDGIEQLPIPPHEVSKQVLKHTSLRMMGWGFAGLIILSIPLAMAAGVDSRRANQETRRTINQNVFKAPEVSAGEIISGFHFFRLGKNDKQVRAMLSRQLRFRLEHVIDVDTGKEYEFNIALN